tara:strand:- start:72 stop:296 length:225 start_codon:yes stop_codon:yes gene_type:complete
MKPGDYVKRGWSGIRREIPPFTFGIIIKVQKRTLEHYTAEQIAEDPIRTVLVLEDSGKMKRWYGIHTQVISEVG